MFGNKKSIPEVAQSPKDACCGAKEIERPPSIRSETELSIERNLINIEKARKLVKFTELFPEATKYLEDNNFNIYPGF